MGVIRALWCLLSIACPIWNATQLIWHICRILKKGPLEMGGVGWVGWAVWFGAAVVATSECGLFSQGFFLGAGAGTFPFTLRYSRHCLLLAGWLPWQLVHFIITVLPDCMAWNTSPIGVFQRRRHRQGSYFYIDISGGRAFGNWCTV